MRSLLILLFCCNFLLSCDDGDVLNVELDFDKNLTLCGDLHLLIIFYTTLKTTRLNRSRFYFQTMHKRKHFNPEVSGNMETMTINKSVSASFTELTTGDPNDYICQDIPDANVSVNENYEAKAEPPISYPPLKMTIMMASQPL